MPNLTDTQLMLLSKATQQDGLVVIPPKLKGAAATKVIKPLIAQGLVNEVPSKPDTAWRRDEAAGQSYALMITEAGPGPPLLKMGPRELPAHRIPENQPSRWKFMVVSRFYTPLRGTTQFI